MHVPIEIYLNGKTYSLEVPANLTLLELIRDYLDIKSVHRGCDEGECGACTVLLDGEPVNACMVLAVEADGAAVVTVEGLAGAWGAGETARADGAEPLHPLQEAFIAAGGVQCGFCTPGMLMSAYALLQRNPNPDEDAIRAAMVGNLCRCTGYTRIVRAIQDAGSKMQDAGSGKEGAR